MISIFFFVNTVFSQDAYIEVKDANTASALPEVTLIFTDLTSLQKHYSSTNHKGITPNIIANKSLLHISYTGFKTVVDTIYPKTAKTYFLETDVFNLDQVVVTATRTDKTLKNTPVLTQVITAKQIESRGLQTVQDILSIDIPGIEFQQHGYGSGINIQGLAAANMLILIDGERLAGETNANIDYSRLNIQEIERVEIVKGASSALYGSQAMGAVINLITKKSNKAFYGSVSNQFTSNFEKNYPDITTNSDDYEFKNNLDRSNLTQNYTLGFNKKKWQGKTNFTHKTKDAYRLHNSGLLYKNYYELDTLVEEARLLTFIEGSKDLTVSQFIGYKQSEKIQFSAKASYYQQHQYDFIGDNIHDFYDDFSYTLKAKIRTGDRLNYTLSYHDDTYQKFDFLEVTDEKRINYKHHILNPKLIGTYSINDTHILTGGIEYYYESLRASILDARFESLSNEVAFVQDDINLPNNWNAVLGARLDHHTSFGAHFSPKVSVMYKNNPLTYRLNYSSGYRSPTLKEMYTELPIGSMFVIRGNPELKPETNQYISFSLEYSKSKINTSVSVYRNAFIDKIDFIWLNNQTLLQYKNTHNATLVGLDYNLHYQPNKSWFIKGAYSYLQELGDDVLRLSSFSPHSGSIQLGYNLRFKKYNLAATITGKYTGEKEDTNLDELFNYQGEIIEAYYTTHYEPYSIWRLSVHQEFNKKVNLTLGINNLFDYTPIMYTFNTSVTSGRNFFIGIKLNIDQFI